jgi:hypothetical protein
MLLRNATRACALLVLFGILAISLGCGPNYKARATVKGKVTFGNKTLTSGTVMFYGKQNLTGQASIDKNGNYEMKDAPIGDVKVTVTVQKPPEGGIGRMKMGPAVGAVKDSKSVAPDGSGRSISIMGEMPTEVVLIPEKYSQPDTSGLTYKVEKGEHVHNILLTP